MHQMGTRKRKRSEGGQAFPPYDASEMTHILLNYSCKAVSEVKIAKSSLQVLEQRQSVL